MGTVLIAEQRPEMLAGLQSEKVFLDFGEGGGV
jgi:hypothetical protein